MDRRVFQPRPNGNDVRRRNAIGMAAIVLLVVWLWTLVSRGASGPGAVSPQPPRAADARRIPPATARR